MASPVDAGRASTSISTAADPWTVNLPGSIASGDLLLIFWRSPSGTGANGPGGWTNATGNITDDASDDATGFFHKRADGTEGATISFDMAASTKGATIAYRVTGAEDPATQVPEWFGSVAVGIGANADPGTITPTGGSKDYLFIEFAGMDGETQTFAASTTPRNYQNITNENSGTGGAAASNCRIGSASSQATVSSENPGPMASGVPSSGWTAFTVAIHPPAASPPRHAGVDHMNPGLLMQGIRRAWHRRRSGIFVPDLWTPEGARI